MISRYGKSLIIMAIILNMQVLKWPKYPGPSHYLSTNLNPGKLLSVSVTNLKFQNCYLFKKNMFYNGLGLQIPILLRFHFFGNFVIIFLIDISIASSFPIKEGFSFLHLRCPWARTLHVTPITWI